MIAGVWSAHLDLAARLGKSLHELMGWPGPMTHRQFLVWRKWIKNDWQAPSRSDWYVMQVAYCVHRIEQMFSGRSAEDLDSFKIAFKESTRSMQGSGGEQLPGIERVSKENLSSMSMALLQSPRGKKTR